MGSTFGRFELDEGARALRLDGVERPLQPLVFDLLVYLVRNRERVVPKDELLARLWDGATVTDGSLQRAVSLLRGALREGHMEQAIQTFARRGYRFCEPEPSASSSSPPGPLEATRLAGLTEGEGALEAFAVSSPQRELSADELLTWGNAALSAGKPEQAIDPLERAMAAFDRAQQPQQAAHVALLLTNVRLEARELAVAKGFHQRAQSYLRGLPESKEHALAAWLASRMALFEGELEECRAHARVAIEIADRVGDPDVHCLGLVYQGHIFIAQSEVRRGLSMHDEAGAAALGGRVTPWVSGIVFCSVIWAYLHIGDHHRAGQWTDQFTRWCERYPSYCYPGLCRLHRSEILAIRGELGHAEVEARKAREQLASAGPFVEGDACRVLGEIKLARGDLDSAEAAFREAHRLGWNPQPGLSLVLAARGERKAAIQQLERSLSQPTWTDGQRRGAMLAVLARVAAMDGDLDRSSAALQSLRDAPELTATRANAAELARAHGELAWAKGDLGDAEHALRNSVAHWLEVSAPLHAAEVRLRLSELLLCAGDATSAELELGSAETAFERVSAKPLITQCEQLRSRLEQS